MLAGFKLKKIYKVGYCLGRGALADRTLSWKKVRFYARAFLLEHPTKGYILVDTGYGEAFESAVRSGIYALYRKLIPFNYEKKDSLVSQLAHDGIKLKDISYLLITHFHADHIGALPEFSNVPWIYRKEALDKLLKLNNLQGLRKGFLRSLVPEIPQHSRGIRDCQFDQPWNEFMSCDLFKDGSLYLIDLPGHALGQMGVFFADILLAADGNWGTKALPHPLGFLLQEDSRAYRKTFNSLAALSSQIQIIPTHTIEDHV